MNINMVAWKHKVSHTCLHALRERGYRWPADIAFVRVSSLLQIPEVDANDVTSMLSALYDVTYRSLDNAPAPVEYGLSKQELAERIRAICMFHGFDRNPDRLLSITAMGLISLTGINATTLPQMVRKIKHIMLGKADPETLLRLPPIPKKEYTEGAWWEYPAEKEESEQICVSFAVKYTRRPAFNMIGALDGCRNSL